MTAGHLLVVLTCSFAQEYLSVTTERRGSDDVGPTVFRLGPIITCEARGLGGPAPANPCK